MDEHGNGGSLKRLDARGVDIPCEYCGQLWKLSTWWRKLERHPEGHPLAGMIVDKNYRTSGTCSHSCLDAWLEESRCESLERLKASERKGPIRSGPSAQDCFESWLRTDKADAVAVHGQEIADMLERHGFAAYGQRIEGVLSVARAKGLMPRSYYRNNGDRVEASFYGYPPPNTRASKDNGLMSRTGRNDNHYQCSAVNQWHVVRWE